MGSPAWLEYYFEEYARTQAASSAAAAAAASTNDRPDPPSFEYQQEEERLERERNIILAAEEEARQAKAMKKKDKKARKKERAKKEAEAKSAAAAKKKREKTISSWRSRVVAACTSGDCSKMEALLSESPYKNYTFQPSDVVEDTGENIPQNEEEYLIQQLEWFLPNVLQKYPRDVPLGKPPFEGNQARELLGRYVMETCFDTVCNLGSDMMRNAIHTASYRNDVEFLQWAIEQKNVEFLMANEDGEFPIEYPYSDALDSLCDDAGWSPLHYAVAAGNTGVVEVLLEAFCDIQTRSDYELTCLNR